MIPLPGRVEGRQALGWVVEVKDDTHPGASRPLSLRTTPPMEGIFRGIWRAALSPRMEAVTILSRRVSDAMISR